MRTRPLLACAAALAACGPASRPRPPAAEPRRVMLEVPFFPDASRQCGPAALAGVLRYWGDEADPDEIGRAVYRPALKGSLAVDLMLAARDRGMLAEVLPGTPARLRQELDAGHPLIAFLNLGFRWYPLGHFVVVTGYDERGVYAHSGLERNSFIPWARFVRRWEKTDQWTLLVLPSPS